MSDISDRNIVITVFVFTFIYINYLRMKIDIKNDWENMKCNPMNLWSRSFFGDVKTANNNFNTCINALSAESIETGLKTAYKKQTDAMNEISKQEANMKTYLNKIDKDINGPGGLISMYNVNESKIDDIKNQQTTYQTINNLLTSKDETENNLYNFTTNVKNIFDNIKQYLPSLH